MGQFDKCMYYMIHKFHQSFQKGNVPGEGSAQIAWCQREVGTEICRVDFQ